MNASSGASYRYDLNSDTTYNVVALGANTILSFTGEGPNPPTNFEVSVLVSTVDSFRAIYVTSESGAGGTVRVQPPPVTGVDPRPILLSDLWASTAGMGTVMIAGLYLNLLFIDHLAINTIGLSALSVQGNPARADLVVAGSGASASTASAECTVDVDWLSNNLFVSDCAVALKDGVVNSTFGVIVSTSASSPTPLATVTTPVGLTPSFAFVSGCYSSSQTPRYRTWFSAWLNATLHSAGVNPDFAQPCGFYTRQVANVTMTSSAVSSLVNVTVAGLGLNAAAGHVEIALSAAAVGELVVTLADTSAIWTAASVLIAAHPQLSLAVDLAADRFSLDLTPVARASTLTRLVVPTAPVFDSDCTITVACPQDMNPDPTSGLHGVVEIGSGLLEAARVAWSAGTCSGFISGSAALGSSGWLALANPFPKLVIAGMENALQAFDVTATYAWPDTDPDELWGVDVSPSGLLLYSSLSGPLSSVAYDPALLIVDATLSLAGPSKNISLALILSDGTLEPRLAFLANSAIALAAEQSDSVSTPRGELRSCGAVAGLGCVRLLTTIPSEPSVGMSVAEEDTWWWNATTVGSGERRVAINATFDLAAPAGPAKMAALDVSVSDAGADAALSAVSLTLSRQVSLSLPLSLSLVLSFSRSLSLSSNSRANTYVG